MNTLFPAIGIKITRLKASLLNSSRNRVLVSLAFVLILALLVSGCSAVPGVSLTVDGQSPEPKQVTSGVQLLVLMTVLSLAPAILILATSFTRIVIVLSMLRSA